MAVSPSSNSTIISMFKGALTFAKFYHTNDEDRQANSVTPNTTVIAATGKFANIVNVTTAGGTVTSGNYAQADESRFYQKRGIQYADFHGELASGDRIKADFGVNYAIATYHQMRTRRYSASPAAPISPITIRSRPAISRSSISSIPAMSSAGQLQHLRLSGRPRRPEGKGADRGAPICR